METSRAQIKPRAQGKARTGIGKHGPMEFRFEYLNTFRMCYVYLTDSYIDFMEDKDSETAVSSYGIGACRWQTSDKDNEMKLHVIGEGNFFVRCTTASQMQEWMNAILLTGGGTVSGNKLTPAPTVAILIDETQKGTKLLKYGKKGDPHSREFKLSSDGKLLTWNSMRKGESVVDLRDVKEILLGKQTENFKRKNAEEEAGSGVTGAVSNCSFSLIFQGSTLDIICPKPNIYNTWTCVLFFLIYYAKKIPQFELDISVATQTQKGKEQAGNLESGDNVVFWGRGDKGQLGCDSFHDSVSPITPKLLLGRDIKQIALGKDHCLAIGKETGELFSWGNGLNGQLGHNDTVTRCSPKIITGLKVDYVACGDFHSLAIGVDKKVYAWGMGYYGQLGQGNRNDLKQPTLVQGISEPVIHIACSSMSSFAITQSGRVFYWGLLDLYLIEDMSHSPRQIIFENNISIKQIECGDSHATAIDEYGCVHTWGDGKFGQLGHGNSESLSTPKKINESAFGGKVDDIACGAAHTVAISGNRFMVWGLILRNSGPIEQLRPMSEDIPECVDDPIVSLSCAAMTTAFATESGKCYVWGVMGMSFSDSVEQSASPLLLKQFGKRKVREVIVGGNQMAAFTNRQWMSDDEVHKCMDCASEFSTFIRRHHCRKCGGIYCNNCSPNQLPILEHGKKKNVRVCKACYMVYTTG